MTDPAAIIARIRARGANVVLDGGGLRIINGNKLPPEAGHFIKQHRDALIGYLQDEADAIEERAGIIEYDGNVSRDAAMAFARQIAATRDWPDRAARLAYLDACGVIVDQAFGAAA